MNTHLISYDLREQGREYQRLYDCLKNWRAVRVLESVWLLQTSRDAEEIWDDLQGYVDRNDALFVARLTGEVVWHGILNSQPVEQIIAAQPAF
ncbi:hypothetical protein [Sabulicella glaciei]|uniref:Uncharacterized protein n=1 Tax=Sabulicella glaciei TaxID=2984948 RepID=A0ABT3P209_9PROT|nr:hypothetical protein [Roseococcus sp. MDT2-1-1]MCW8088437.1 hypothetical protein [Roseococcus sp. MDT2-1-1]